MFRNKSVSSHSFAMVPKSSVPRSAFQNDHVHKTSFDAGVLVPIFVDEVLPGDSFNVNMTAFCRLATPIFPFMDNLHLDCFFFFTPMRLLWEHSANFFGEQVSPSSSTDFLIPIMESPINGWPIGSVGDYMGLPTEGQMGGGTVDHSSLPFRMYNLVWNEWFRDENLQDPLPFDFDDGPDDSVDYQNLARRGKRHDYFTSCLPWPQKGAAVTMSLAGSAPVRGLGMLTPIAEPVGEDFTFRETPDVTRLYPWSAGGGFWAASAAIEVSTGVGATAFPMVFADLTAVSSFTINMLRTSMAIQRLLERDARGGTRYTEYVRAAFGVLSPDARLQRPEYLGGGSTPVSISPVPQTSATSVDSPQGNLAAMGQVVSSNNSFSYSATEHGYMLGLVSVRADLTYQQGISRMWTRRTRYEFYDPAFANLGEQAVLSQEIWCDGGAGDITVFGYQERWAEYRYHPSRVSSLMRSTAASTIDVWHLAERFDGRPLLNSAFIADNSQVPIERVVAVHEEAGGQQFLGDFYFSSRIVRPMPQYSVPGFGGRF